MIAGFLCLWGVPQRASVMQCRLLYNASCINSAGIKPLCPPVAFHVTGTSICNSQKVLALFLSITCDFHVCIQRALQKRAFFTDLAAYAPWTSACMRADRVRKDGAQRMRVEAGDIVSAEKSKNWQKKTILRSHTAREDCKDSGRECSTHSLLMKFGSRPTSVSAAAIEVLVSMERLLHAPGCQVGMMLCAPVSCEAHFPLTSAVKTFAFWRGCHRAW